MSAKSRYERKRRTIRFLFYLPAYVLFIIVLGHALNVY